MVESSRAWYVFFVYFMMLVATSPPRQRMQRNLAKGRTSKQLSPPGQRPLWSRICPRNLLDCHCLRTCRACRRPCQKRIQSPLAPPGRVWALRRPLRGWPVADWRVCQRKAPHAVASGGHWHRRDRDVPAMDVRLDAGLARDRDVVLTLTIERRATTLAPAT